MQKGPGTLLGSKSYLTLVFSISILNQAMEVDLKFLKQFVQSSMGKGKVGLVIRIRFF